MANRNGTWGIEGGELKLFIFGSGLDRGILLSVPNSNMSWVFHIKPIPICKLNELSFTCRVGSVKLPSFYLLDRVDKNYHPFTYWVGSVEIAIPISLVSMVHKEILET